MKRIGVLILALVMVFSLAGCGSKKLSGMTAEEIMTKVQETMSGLESYTGAVTTNLSMSMMGSEMEMASTSDMTMFTNPLKTRVVTSVDMTYSGTTQNQEVTVYVENREGSYFVYTSDEAGEYTVEEITEAELDEKLKSLMGMGAAEQYLGVLSSVEKAEGLETIDGVECVKVTAQISGDAVGDLIAATGMQEAFEGMLTSEMFKGLEPANVTYWIDNEKAYIVKGEVEMSDMLSALFSAMFSAAAEEYGEQMEGIDMSSMIRISEASSVSTFANFNAAEKFDMPEAAKAADTTEETGTTEAADTTETAGTADTTGAAGETTETTADGNAAETVDTAEDTTSNTTEATETQAQ